MHQTLSAPDAVELAVVERSGFIESRHVGAAVVVAADGTVLTRLGDVAAPVYPRSALKPFQALAVLQSSVPLTGAQVALAAASHTGTAEHVAVVEQMLAAAGLDASHLGCPPAWPADEAARDAMVRAGQTRTPLAMNCSGKHAAFLWACTENGWDPARYLEPSHPLQRRVMDVIETYTGESVAHIGVDGCGAPLAAVSLTGLARAVSALAFAPRSKSGDARAATVATTMLDYPWAVHGPGEANTIVLERLGIIAKNGAEGVVVMGAPDGTAVAVKMLDGSGRATSLIALTLLAVNGAVPVDELGPVLEQIVPPVTGAGAPVGRIRLSPEVSALLD